MSIEILYLKTMFCCMACDGTIAEEEIQVLQQASKDFAFEGDLSRYLSEWIDLLGVQGASFFEAYFQELRSEVVSSPQAINLLGLIKTPFNMYDFLRI